MLDLAALKDSARRAVRAIDVLGRILSRDLSDPSRTGDPHLRPAARDLARVIWLMGLPDQLKAGGPAAARALPEARAAERRISSWLLDVSREAGEPLVIDVAEDPHHGGWSDPIDRLRAFACESTADALAEFRADLDAVAGDPAA